MRLALFLLVLPAVAGRAGCFDPAIPRIDCVDAEHRPVLGVVRNGGGYTAVATVEGGQPLIVWNARALRFAAPPTRLFVYLHECAHHVLRHVYQPEALAHEMAANCWALQRMTDGGLVHRHEVETIERELLLFRGDSTHLGGEELVASLGDCARAPTDAGLWRERLDRLLAASRDSFRLLRGDALGRVDPGAYAATLDVPGAWDCAVRPPALYDCTLYDAPMARHAAQRYDKVVKIVRRWLPPGWTAAEQRGDGERWFSAQEPASGTTLSLRLRGESFIAFSLAPGGPPRPMAAAP